MPTDTLHYALLHYTSVHLTTAVWRFSLIYRTNIFIETLLPIRRVGQPLACDNFSKVLVLASVVAPMTSAYGLDSRVSSRYTCVVSALHTL
jgi:hypothetical protein